MKRFLLSLVALILGFVHVAEAKKASAIWYFLEQTSSSVVEDDNISIEYRIQTEYAVEEYALGPYPTFKITITNKSNKVVFIDLGTSFIKRNGYASVIFTPMLTSTTNGKAIGIGFNVGALANAVGVGGRLGSLLSGINVGGSRNSSITTTTYAQRVVSIPPRSNILLDNIPVFTYESQSVLNGYIYYKNVGIPKRLWCLAPKSSQTESGKAYDYTEYNSPFTIGCYMNYSFTENFDEPQGIETMYYVKRKVGSLFSTFPFKEQKEFNIVREVFPDWDVQVGTGNLNLIRLWAR